MKLLFLIAFPNCFSYRVSVSIKLLRGHSSSDFAVYLYWKDHFETFWLINYWRCSAWCLKIGKLFQNVWSSELWRTKIGMLPINDLLAMFEIQTLCYRESKTASCVENPIHIVFEHCFTTPRLKPENQLTEFTRSRQTKMSSLTTSQRI